MDEFSAADAALEVAPDMTPAEQFAVVRAIQAMQHQRVCDLEDDLAEARRELADTTRRMNAMAAEISKA